MATEAARLKRKNLLGGKTKTDLTLTALLMEGLGRQKSRDPLLGPALVANPLFQGREKRTMRESEVQIGNSGPNYWR